MPPVLLRYFFRLREAGLATMTRPGDRFGRRAFAPSSQLFAVWLAIVGAAMLGVVPVWAQVPWETAARGAALTVPREHPIPNAIPGGAVGASWLYGSDLGTVDGSSTLVQVDPVSGFTAPRGEIGSIMADIAFRQDGRLFGITFSRLYILNPTNGPAFPVGTDLGFSSNALTVGPDGTLYAAAAFGTLLTVNPVNGRATPIGDYGDGLGSSGDLAFSPDGVLYATVTDGAVDDLLAQIDVVTGRATVIGGIGFADVFGLAFGPDGRLYGSSHAPGQRPQLIVIDRLTGRGTLAAPIAWATGIGGLAARVVTSPVVGPLRMTSVENPSCVNDLSRWTFCQHQTPPHVPGAGLQGADDTRAWDANLPNNTDAGRAVFPVAVGRVVPFAGVVPPGGTSGAVLVEHSIDGLSCDVYPDHCWWSAYLHVTNMLVAQGQLVGPNTPIGSIGRVGTTTEVLHLAFYEGANRPGGLRSFDAVIHNRLRVSSGDFDGDGRADFTVYRPSNGTWYARRSRLGAQATTWGVPDDLIVPADYDGDGSTDVAVFRPSIGAWYIVSSATGMPFGFLWGADGDRPVPADYDGDGRADTAVFRPSTGTWQVRHSTTGGTLSVPWGDALDVPVPADYDGDGRADIAVFRPSNGTWYLINAPVALQWGGGSDVPVPGDYDGDGKADLAVFRPSNGTWYIRSSATGGVTTVLWGSAADVPVPGDYDGDGRTDIAVFRESVGTWYVRGSSLVTQTVQWGWLGDIPIGKRP